MSSRKYDLITSSSMAAAVLSALLFDRVGRFHWAMGALGVAAGVTAALTYFYNQHCTSTAVVDGRPTGKAVRRPAVFVSLPTIDKQPIKKQIPKLLASVPTVKIMYYRRTEGLVDITGLASELDLWCAQRRLNPKFRVLEAHSKHHASMREEFVDEVVEIVQRLAPTCEFDLSPAGKLTIRPRTSRKAGADLQVLGDLGPEGSVTRTPKEPTVH